MQYVLSEKQYKYKDKSKERRFDWRDVDWEKLRQDVENRHKQENIIKEEEEKLNTDIWKIKYDYQYQNQNNNFNDIKFNDIEEKDIDEHLLNFWDENQMNDNYEKYFMPF